ncbi:hypothetical protein BP6252_12951 [Coleophoma cylindrospora]|uniref:Uncharacterized protein n=1 Tax=Coleophoma cylindrospora TaxID=1849047 RepID=A0A3D8QEK5_9HELO|nr:hypothetical protein BP6252_12951 [Coleophoma cylindrospora]
MVPMQIVCRVLRSGLFSQTLPTHSTQPGISVVVRSPIGRAQLLFVPLNLHDSGTEVMMKLRTALCTNFSTYTRTYWQLVACQKIEVGIGQAGIDQESDLESQVKPREVLLVSYQYDSILSQGLLNPRLLSIQDFCQSSEYRNLFEKPTKGYKTVLVLRNVLDAHQVFTTAALGAGVVGSIIGGILGTVVGVVTHRADYGLAVGFGTFASVVGLAAVGVAATALIKD